MALRGIALLACATAIMVASCTSSAPPSVQTGILAPAPKPLGGFNQCPFGPVRASGVASSSLVSVMANHVPRWLPPGMGLVEAFGPGEYAFGGAYFADADCREIQLYFWESSDTGSGPRLGPWVITADVPNGCSNAALGQGRCLEYHAKVPGGSVGVQMMGIDRAAGDRIVGSIPL
jgi:hypothetical protein